MPGPEDFFLNCGASIARDLVWGAIREARYCCCFNNFVKDFKKEKEELLKYKERVDEDARGAEKENKKIHNDDKDWLEEADKLEEQVEKLEAKVEKYKSCCLGRCPNWICRYLLGRQLKIKKDNVKLHCDKRPKDRIERLATLQGMEYFSSKNFMRFESRELALEQLMEAIQDDGVSMIGLYGMGGSGKTTLAKEVGKEAEQLFNYKVVFVVVSREGVRRIQDKIASSLGLELNEKEEIDRAKRLSMRLRNNDKRLLIILDDVWEKLDFEAIGIPFGENRKGCKVLMTTRPLSVCNLMDCQKTIPLSLLSFEESWDLFQKHAQFSDETSNAFLKDLAKQFTEKCDGLPVAIAAVASTLKGKTQVEWEVALKDLKDSRPMDIEEGLRDPYACLELSYNNLQSREAKSLFLLCSIFPEDREIHCLNLFVLGIGLGLFGRVSSYVMARKQASVAKSKLINSCLLLEAKDDEGYECVKMHDLVRDVALLLAKKENKAIMRIRKEENYLEEDSITEGTQIKYLCCDEFPNKLDYTELELVFFCSDSEFVRVPCEFFERKKKLRVMFLCSDGYRRVLQLPDSIQTLINLRCLILKRWELGDISFLGNLKGLESLVLDNCRFHELPNAIAQLTKLSILKVSNCEIAKAPCDVIGRCSQLEDLYFTRNRGIDWKSDNEIAAEFLDKFNVPKRLQNYSIQVGGMTRKFYTASGCISRSLVIEYFDASTSNATIKDLVEKTECLSLGHIKGGCKNIIPDIIGGGMTELIELVLHDSKEIESLIDTTNLQCQVGTLFSKLSKLWIKKMHHLEALCHGLPPSLLFEKLEKIYICECSQLNGVLFIGKLNLRNLEVLELKNCPKLTSIFTADSVQSLSQLQDLKIDGCSELNHIITEEVKEEIIEDDNDQRTNQLPFQKLKRIIVRRCIQLKYTIPVSYARGLVQLESMEIAAVDELKFLFGQRSHANQLADAAENDFQVKLPVLKLLELSGFPNIVSIFPENYYPVWPSLHELHLIRCPQFSIMSLQKCAVGSEVKQHCGPTKDLNELSYKSLVKLKIYGLKKIKSVFSACSMKSMPQLEELRIGGCNQLEQIIASEEHHNIMNTGTESCSKSTSNCCTLHSGSLDLCNLKRVYLANCPMLKSLFTLSIVRTLTSLETLEVSYCHGLKEIIQNDSDLQSHDSVIPKLKDLYIHNCNSLECIFLVSFTQGLVELKTISIWNAPQLQYLFGEGSLEHHSSQQYQNIIQFGLPILEDLTLQSLPNLISICPNNYHAVCSSLKRIMLKHVGLSNSTRNNSKGGSEDRHWDCTSTKDLNELSYKSLLKLEIYGLKKIKSVFSTCSMKSMPQLEELRISGCNQLEQIIASEEHHNIMNTGTESCSKSTSNCCTLHSGSLDLCSLKRVYLANCLMLKSLFTLSIARTLTSLETLDVSFCYRLKEIIQNDSDLQSHDSVFPKLKDLYIHNCNSLECIFLVSFTQGLMELKKISILNAPQLQYLFGEGSLEHHSSHQYQNIIQFGLPVLEDLTLQWLPNLISICPNNYHAVCSSLKRIMLKHVGLSNSTRNNSKGGSEDRHWDCTSTKDLRATIMKLVQNSEEHIIGKENDLLLLREMGLQNQHEIMYMCISPKRLLNLQNLLELRVQGCGKLKAMFSVSVLRSLPQLKALLMTECEELEQITIEDEENENLSNPSAQKGSFPQLKVLIIKCCNKLKFLFSISTSREFPKLEFLIIKEASQLEEVFESEKRETEERKEVVLSELKYLFLVQLPILTHVWQGMQTVTYRVVQNCPKLFLTITPQKSLMELHMEIEDNIYDHHKDLTWELRKILLEIIKETYDEDPMLKSEVSDFGDEAASWSGPPSSQIIEEKGKEIVGYVSASKAPAIATSSIDVHELMDEHSISEPTLLGQQLALGEPKLTTKVPQEIISSHQSVEAIPHETAKESPTSKEAVITTLSDDIALPIGPLPKVSAQEQMNERSETIMTNQQDFREMTSYIHSNASRNGVSEDVQEDLPIKKADTMTSLTDLEPGSFTSLHKSSPQDTEVVVKESSQEGPSFEKATIATLSNDLAPRNSLPAGSLAIGPPQKASHLGVVHGIHEGLPIEKAKTVASSSKIILTEQEATEGNEITNNSVNSLLDPGQNEPKLKMSSLCPPIALSDKTFSQISSNSAISPSSSTSAILLAELCTKSGIDKFSASTEFLGSRLILEPGRLQELKTKLTQSFNMPLEAVFETNTLDDVESIVNSLAMGTTDVIQKNILEDLKSRLKQFKECVPKAISTMQSSFDFMSNYESQNVELNTKLSKGQGKLRDLECKISETRAKEYAVDMKIQQLFAQKMEILEQRKSLASQRNESTEAVSKDYVKWEALRKKLKVSTENWLKSKEDLAHANATWKLFKESLGL